MYIFDRQPFTKRTYTDEGYLVAPARLARTGIQEYYAFQLGLTDRSPTDIVKVYRPESEVFNDESISSFKSAPVTDGHPEELLNANIAKQHIVGYVIGEIVRDGIHLSSEIKIIDSETIKKIELGKYEISNGYKSDIDFTAGVTDSGEEYDAIQTNIRGNHVAIVERGRCGPSCRISDEEKPEPTKKEHTMIVKINGVDYEVADQAGQAVNQVIAQRDEAIEEVDKLKKTTTDSAVVDQLKEEHKSEVDTLQAKLDDALAKAPTPEMLDELADQRYEVISKAKAMVDSFDSKGKTCDAIRKEVVAAKCTDVDIEKVSEDYIRARFDALTIGVENGVDKAVSDSVTNDGGENKDVVDEARNKFAERNRNRWNKAASGGDK